MKNDSLKQRKYKFYATWDLESIGKFIGLFVILVLAIWGFTLFSTRPNRDDMNRDKDYYNESTKAVIYSIDSKTSLTQGRFGNKETTLGYDISYNYEVNGIKYDKVDFMNDNLNSENNEFVKFAYNNLNMDFFIVRYASSKPEDGFLVKTLDKKK